MKFYMFSVEAQEGVFFESSWKTERSVKDSFAQTSEIITYEADAQAVFRTDVEIQTEEVPEREITIATDDSQNLVDFILRVYPDVSRQLQSNIRSHAFDGYDVDWEEKSSSVSCEYKLVNEDKEEDEGGGGDDDDGSSGGDDDDGIGMILLMVVVVVVMGMMSSLCTWNIDRKALNPNKPDTTVDLSSCLMSIAFHPLLPAVIAGGTFNGEVQLWDLSKEDEMLTGTSGLGSDSHREPVTKVMWISDPSSKGKKYQILSTSGDGKVLLWRLLSQGSQDLKIVGGYVLQTRAVPRSMRLSKAKGDTEMGDTASSVPLTSPVTFAFSPHIGPVFSVECSPYHRNLFLTCGTDGTIRIYTMLQSKPLLSLEPGAGYLFRVRWSPVRPLVFSVVTADGKLLIYDLKTNRINPVVTLEVSSKKNPVHSLEYNIHSFHAILQTSTAIITTVVIIIITSHHPNVHCHHHHCHHHHQSSSQRPLPSSPLSSSSQHHLNSTAIITTVIIITRHHPNLHCHHHHCHHHHQTSSQPPLPSSPLLSSSSSPDIISTSTAIITTVVIIIRHHLNLHCHHHHCSSSPDIISTSTATLLSSPDIISTSTAIITTVVIIITRHHLNLHCHHHHCCHHQTSSQPPLPSSPLLSSSSPDIISTSTAIITTVVISIITRHHLNFHCHHHHCCNHHHHHQRHLIATGDSEGFIKIWKLSDELTVQGSSEVEILDDLAETQAD
ncbi:hypothetical protein QZH41_014224 [Actinostola sp. cb2023]|nr:hypothetical protein QZH41_014224 [Actinostola sp. cb2023]